MQGIIASSQQEIARLSNNSRQLFDLLPDMLFIVKDDFTIERMNTAAVSRFGKQEGRKCYNIIMGARSACDMECCPYGAKRNKNSSGKIFERKLDDSSFVEYSHVPFEGYREDKLTLLIVRDITQKKRHELELEKYSKNIEKVLREKIAVLKESESERQQLYNEVNYLKNETERFTGQDKMIGESKPIRALREMIHQVAASSATVLITGESGTGKELVADLVYKHSSRIGKPYLKFNCAAVTESLLESDLFGYEKGAFTGATATHKGKFEEADGGTIFLDEIGAISPRMQSGLLRVLQEGELVRVGSSKPVTVDVRIIAATNSDLDEAVKKGTFREDLYYRLNVINLRQVPLRERKEDIVILATSFLVKYREKFNKEVTFLPNSVVEKLLAYDWPGNVRELENVIQRAVLLSRDGMISPATLGINLKSTRERNRNTENDFPEKLINLPLKESVRRFEADVICRLLKENPGKIDNVCEQLGLAKTTLYEKMKRYGINPRQPRKKTG
jgi:transcriptional regulator with PAS, ATPase and Fis domain